MDQVLIILLFFLVAVVYSSAGFGGGSSYLAILAFFAIDFLNLRLIALCCNIVVVSGSFYLFYKNGFIKPRQILPLIVLSVPMAFLGGLIKIDQATFFIILGITLLIASIFMLFGGGEKKQDLPKYSNGIIGGIIGLLSGIVGIGGGIFLSPVLHLTRWDTTKVIAATTATFILVNSIAGLIGQLTSGNVIIDYGLLLPLLVAVFVGGQIGSRLTIYWLKPIMIKRITAILIFIVAIRILRDYIF